MQFFNAINIVNLSYEIYYIGCYPRTQMWHPEEAENFAIEQDILARSEGLAQKYRF